jgi:hypothetical protein
VAVPFGRVTAAAVVVEQAKPLNVHGAETGHGVAKVRGVEGGRLVELARREPLSQRTERHEVDAEFKRRQDRRFGLAPPE